jgi:hypothetical protein
MANPNRFYTYAYLREDGTPYYIGKGTKQRIYDNRRITKIPKDKSRIIFLKQNLTEEEAFKHEIYMIALFGRKDLGTGILHNRTDGGEGMSGHIPDEKTRIKMSNSHKGRIFSEEHKKKIAESNKTRHISIETRIKMSLWIRSEETKLKMSKAKKGKPLSEQHKQKIREWNMPEETKIKMSNSKKGMKWWCNGIQTKFALECPGEGWILGRKFN